MVWSQLDLQTPHIAYACVGIFSTLFSLVSLFVKERLYIGEATVATIAGLILGPHCLGWFDPVTWGNTDYITLEICRIVLCIQIVAVAVELPKKYMKKHWLSVFIFLLPVMTCGWLIVGLFIWILIPHFNFSDALLVSACVTATDPVLAAAVVGKGKFAERVPGHLRNLLSAESGCNDGMAFPFIFLSLNLVLHPGKPGTILKDWFLLTILWECIFGCILGAVIGYVLRKLVKFAENRNLIDRESFLAIFIFLAFNSAGIGSMLGVDDLLVSFAAGTAFGWNGEFSKKTEESHVSTVIDLLLNLAFFVYLGAIIPWPQFNDHSLGLDVWRLIILAIVIIFLRRVPAVVLLKPITPDVKTWNDALFCGHFGPIGVGAIFAAILARKDLESFYTTEETPLAELPNPDHPHYQLLVTIWPLVCFIVITSIVVHGSSVAVLTLGRRLNKMAITLSFTITENNEDNNAGSWFDRLNDRLKLADLEKNESISLSRIDTDAPIQRTNTVETSGIKVRPAGGATRKKKLERRKRRTGNGPGSKIRKSLSRVTTQDQTDPTNERQRPQTEVLQLGQQKPATVTTTPQESPNSSPIKQSGGEDSLSSGTTSQTLKIPNKTSGLQEFGEKFSSKNQEESIPTTVVQDGNTYIIEDQHGEIVDTFKTNSRDASPRSRRRGSSASPSPDEASIHSEASLRRHMSQYSFSSDENVAAIDDEIDAREGSSSSSSSISRSENEKSIDRTLSKTLTGKKKSLYKKDDPKHKVNVYQIDNLIIIENMEGEVIRRYKVNHRTRNRLTQSMKEENSVRGDSTMANQQPRGRSGSIVGRALKYVGFKNKDGSVAQESSSTGVGVPTIHVSGDDHQIKDSSVTAKPKSKPSAAGEYLAINRKREPSLDEDDEEDEDEDLSQDSEASDIDDDDDDEILQETEVERRRRLAALGKLPTTHRHEDDEED
ncbi:Na+/H+ exchanger CtNHA1 [Scheffersomyces coipomensis]|uniref:Na+/H+ exchanger CtNHA1 n=1 Tax=Scheffersomyces coipomensis TaxID=1788519 RepID=UPI00315CC005